MAIYSAGRRRTMIILLLTSVLLITLDLRGNAVFNAVRSGFEYAFRPFEIAGEVVTRPVSRVWRGVTEVDDLEAENEQLRDIIDRQRSVEILADNAIIENRELRAQAGLEALADIDRVTGQLIGQSPSNFDQRVEINKGSVDGIRIGMPVTTPSGNLVGKITNVNPTTSVVMLITDVQYAVPVKVVGLEPAVPDTTVPPSTVPSGIPVGDVTTTTAPTTTTSTTTTSTTSTTVPEVADEEGGALGPELGTTTSTTTTSTTTTTTIPLEEVTRETGLLEGLGPDALPRVRFILDSPQFGRIEVGDSVLTAGGSQSLAPPNIPVGKVANKIENPGTRGLELEVELNADLDRLNFLTVVLYVSPTESPALLGR